MSTITAGFLPLIDASILIVAAEMGMAEDQGLELELVRETSWANVRDRLAVGHFDVAHCLAPLPIATNLGLSPFDLKLVAPMALGSGGNAITVSHNLLSALELAEPRAVNGDPMLAGRALKSVIAKRAVAGVTPLRFGVVHPHSAHNLELRYWLSACGVRPDIDIEIVVLPPSLMADALAADRLDGYCVGEPWNTIALAKDHGRILTTKNAIWASSPEKVLTMPASFAESQRDTVFALLRALYRAAAWCSDPDNRSELASLLADPAYVGIPAEILLAALSGPSRYESFQGAATFPWQSHALWFYSQLARWSMVEPSATAAETARLTYRPDFYRAALADFDAVLPTASAKVEGALTSHVPVGATGGGLKLGPDGFFDGQIFDPDKVGDYIAKQSS